MYGTNGRLRRRRVRLSSKKTENSKKRPNNFNNSKVVFFKLVLVWKDAKAKDKASANFDSSR